MHRKISGCFRSKAGAERFAHLRSYLSTTRKNDVSAIDALTRLFNGIPGCHPNRPEHLRSGRVRAMVDRSDAPPASSAGLPAVQRPRLTLGDDQIAGSVPAAIVPRNHQSASLGAGPDLIPCAATTFASHASERPRSC